MQPRHFRRSLPFVALLTVVACANSGKSPPDQLVNSPGSGADATTAGSSGGPGVGGSSPSGDDGGSSLVFSDAGLGDVACQQLDVTFAPRIPLVYVLVDRSGSIFQTINSDAGPTDEWTPLRAATLGVIQGLQSQVAFGFGAYTGVNPGTLAGMCPILETVPIALNNYAAISSLYSSLGPLENDAGQSLKAETPAELSLELAGKTLTQAASVATDAGAPGSEYVLFVTDGETDFCDDGDAVCPADAVTAEIQKLYTQGIQTLILGLPSDQSTISAFALQNFANAGVGMPTQAPPSSPNTPPLLPSDIYNRCNSVGNVATGWKNLFMADGLQAGQSLATYVAPDASVTNATLYQPGSTNVADLTAKLAAALNTVKSCAFDLQGKIKVDLAHASEGSVTIDGAAVPYDATNGWTMGSATELDLVGTACTQWRATGKDIHFAFPCDVLIILQ